MTVERPKNREHGDYATNVALQLAKAAGRPPREVAELIAVRLRAVPGVARVDIAGPGFLNITLDTAAQGELARSIVTAGAGYGHVDTLAGQRINLEFVSANPTGPIHIGGTRWAAVGDSLARILSASGAQVAREYYFNDHGVQIDRFARSLSRGRAARTCPPTATAAGTSTRSRPAIKAKVPGVLDLPPDEAQEVFRREGVEMMFAEIKAEPARLRRRLRRLLPRERPARVRRGRARDRRGCASSATSTRPTARSGCAPPTSGTTRTAWSSSPTATRRTSPATSPTT